ncbi:MAG: hypothetical protein A3B82_04500 [Methylophilales bacterium RIFCSPHIGHO2_02_FULL_57_10]|nr:MAG: hypothetical protein A3B82_04500 [Methylophilales bacterium RIFCSPHIGHO2_02_FULL_57_10]
MRRFALILFMCLFPLQVTWAAVADYCGHEEGKATQHFGHHTDEHKLSYDADDDGTQTGKSGSLHDHCHVSEFTGILNTHMIAALPSMRVVTPFVHPIYPSLLPDKPERPKWTALA